MGQKTPTLAIVIVEDNPRYRESLEQLFTYSEGFRLERSFSSAVPMLDEMEQLIGAGREPNWNLVLMDLALPGTSGIQAIRRVKQALPQVPVVALTVFEEPQTILEAITEGADGYLLKKTPAKELLSQLSMIAGGGAPLTAGVARTVLQLLRGGSGPLSSGIAPTALDLTAREQEVLQCLVRGLSYKQIAHQLAVSLDTIRTHIRSVYRKLQVHSVSEAVAKAIRSRLV